MSESFLKDRVVLHCGDCRDVLVSLEENSIDSCVTDPPYGLEFMNVAWDTFSDRPKGRPRTRNEWQDFGSREHPRNASQQAGIARNKNVAFETFSSAWAREVYRVLKPGAHLLAFGGTRTYHRMACAIEDAGFEIRDTISWNFGSGFPKSHSCAKAILDLSLAELRRDAFRLMDKAGGSLDRCSDRCRLCDARLLLAQVDDQLSEPSQRDAQEHIHRRETLNGDRKDSVSRNTAFSSVVFYRLAMPDLRDQKDVSSWQLLRALTSCLCQPCFEQSVLDAFPDAECLNDIDWNKTDAECVVAAVAKSEIALRNLRIWSQSYEQYIAGIAEFEGFGTALKPAMELVCLARKPLSEKTVAANVLKWGTGAINVDGCRVAAETSLKRTTNGHIDNGWGMGAGVTGGTARWPANVIHDGSEEVVGAFPESESQSGGNRGASQIWGGAHGQQERNGFDDSGSAARFFYTSKADQDDRLGSRHPTIKPLDLMQYLVRLITPPKGTCLDPFAGTGTTGEAAFREGMSAVLIEREAEYQDDIRRRMKLVMSGPDERARESIKQRMNGKPRDDGPLFEFYNADRDFSESINECYRDIRERVANGGPGWGGWPE